MMRVIGSALVACVFATQASAQVILQGRFMDRSGQPAVAALITLTDRTGAAIDETLSDSTGAYMLEARELGLHYLQIERIGFATQRGSVQLATPVTGLTDTLRAEPRSMGVVRVGAVERCGQDSTMSNLWQDARTALRIMALAEEREVLQVRGVRYLRELDANARTQLAIIDQETFAATVVPVREPPPDAPPGHWFALTDSTGSMYFAASARALASDEFERDHCFTRITSHATDTARVGLAFEPRPAISTVGIAGTVWLERGTARLQSVEYTYQVGQGEKAVRVAGLVEFAAQQNSLPHVSRWWLRMPVTRSVSRDRETLDVHGIVEDGALVLNRDHLPISDPDELFPALQGAIALAPIIVESRAETRRRVIIPTVSARPFDVLTDREIRFGVPTNAFDLVATTRPRWLRQPTRLPVAVYVDGFRTTSGGSREITGETEQALRQIPVPWIEAMQYLDPLEAPAYLGMGNASGAILITLRKR